MLRFGQNVTQQTPLDVIRTNMEAGDIEITRMETLVDEATNEATREFYRSVIAAGKLHVYQSTIIKKMAAC